MVFPGDPSDFEDWSVWRNFHEAGRLMTTHFYVFLPTVVSHLFPGALFSVVYVQFLLGNLSLGAPFPRWLLSGLLYGVFISVPTDLVAYASNKVLHAMKTSVYALDPVKCRNGESLRVLVTDLLHCGRGCYGGRRPWAVAVGIACFLVFILVQVPPAGFGPAAGMPKWMGVLFTPLLVAGMCLVNLYIVLLFNLVARLWMYAGASAILA